ncbi:MAG TPA: NAD(P)-dependent oxidoreductase [Candidatus Limnocylindrales bacterium]|nr:NAD(P)-dependent oxidoreductase [Candidatus Limnocylindrales bacterium]
MTVLVAGASGVFGRHLVNALGQARYRVETLGRGSDNDISADLLDREQLMNATTGHQADVVVHAATALRKPPLRERDMRLTNHLRITGTRNLIEAASAMGATRMISESMAFGYGFGDHGPHPLTEGDRFGDDPGVPNALKAKEEMTFEFGLGGVALRFGLFYGPGATETLVKMLNKRILPVVNSPFVLPWVELRDAAAATVAAIEHGRPGEAYNIAEPVSKGFGAMVRAVAEAYHTPTPLRIPLWMVRPFSYLHTLLSTNLTLDVGKAERELGWKPRHDSL